jgi:hypothetical protein
MELLTEAAELSKLTEAAFAWPNPQRAGLPATSPLDASPACEIVGLNNQRVAGRLTRFAPDEKIIHVQLHQARRSAILRFDQFRVLALTEPLALPAGGPPPSAFDIEWADGTSREGQTESWQERSFGIFLSVPLPQASACVPPSFRARAFAARPCAPRPPPRSRPGSTCASNRCLRRRKTTTRLCRSQAANGSPRRSSRPRTCSRNSNCKAACRSFASARR